MSYIYGIILFVTDFEDGTVKIKPIHSEEIIENMFDKNLSNGPFNSLTSRCVFEVLLSLFKSYKSK